MSIRPAAASQFSLHIKLIGSRATVSAALYLASLPAGRRPLPNGYPHFTDREPSFEEAQTMRLPVLDQASITPAKKFESDSRLHSSAMIEIVSSSMTAAPGCECTLSLDTTLTADALECMLQKWSARVPAVLFVVTRRTDEMASADVRAYIDGQREFFGLGRIVSDGESLHMDGAKQFLLKHFSGGRLQEAKQPAHFSTVNLQGPRALAELIRSNRLGETARAERLAIRADSISCIDMAIMTPLGRFGRHSDHCHIDAMRHPVQETDRSTPSQDDIDTLFAPRVDVSRLRELAALCASEDMLAEAIAGPLGYTANGLHVTGLMARVCRPHQTESTGLRKILARRTQPFNPMRDAESRTIQALACSGSTVAWEYLESNLPEGLSMQHIAMGAMRYEEDVEACVRLFGRNPFVTLPGQFDACRRHGLSDHKVFDIIDLVERIDRPMLRMQHASGTQSVNL